MHLSDVFSLNIYLARSVGKEAVITQKKTQVMPVIIRIARFSIKHREGK